ncbi:2-oxoglutarate dehydrogenase, E2 component, dihydrolipoamide succinyltransferase [Actinomyces oris]|nr:2-oxoglutarate dehydrogenase, E2 component, dihydrolipoamide succinyltransferase [Actinomyces oris]
MGDPSQAGSAQAPAAPAPQAAPEPPAPAPTAEAPAPAAPAPVSTGASGSYVTPIVRKLAKDKGVDLSTVTGTGVGGRIRKQDVEAAAKAAEEARAAAAVPAPAAEAPAPAAAKSASAKPEVDTTLRGRTEKMSRLRQVIADRMIDSLQTSAQLTTVVEVDVTRVAALRARAKNDFLAKNGTKLTFLPFFVQAATEALKAHPKINASIEGKNVTYHDVEHVGIAVDTPRGLLVPVVKNAGDLNIPGLARRINDLAARTRDNKVNPDELSGSTFTITNTGSGGALFDTPIINQPEVAILGLGAIQRQPRVIKDADGGEVIAIRSVCYLALSYDHRLVDGADAARYLMTVKKRLEEGDFGGELGL